MRNLSGRGVAVFAVTVGVALAAVMSPGVAAWAAPTPRWQAFYTSPHGPTDLTGITSIGPKNAWASGDDSAGLYLVHWNGSRWRPVTVPDGRGFSPQPGGIQVTSANNVWVFGTTRRGQPEALVSDGHSWHLVPLPTDFATVLSSSDVWGIGAGGGCTGGSHPMCTSSVWHWHDGTITSYPLAGEGAAVAGVGKHVWILSQTDIKDSEGPHQSSVAALYSADVTGLHRIPGPGGRMGYFPQLAAGPRGELCVLAPGIGAHGRSAVDNWNGRRWARHAVPNAADIYFGSWGFTSDDHRGAWLGPYVHWTGSRWISTDPHGPTQAFELMYVAPIPGSASAWAVGFNSARPGTRAYRGLIALYGHRP